MEITSSYINVPGVFSVKLEALVGLVPFRNHTFLFDVIGNIYEIKHDIKGKMMEHFKDKPMMPGPFDSIWDEKYIQSAIMEKRNDYIQLEALYTAKEIPIVLRFKHLDRPFNRSVAYRTKIYKRSTGQHWSDTGRVVLEKVHGEEESDVEDEEDTKDGWRIPHLLLPKPKDFDSDSD
jgi:hypothetical protein